MALPAAAEVFDFLAHLEIAEAALLDAEFALQFQTVHDFFFGAGVGGGKIKLGMQFHRPGDRRFVGLHCQSQQVLDLAILRNDIENDFFAVQPLVIGSDHSAGANQESCFRYER